MVVSGVGYDSLTLSHSLVVSRLFLPLLPMSSITLPVVPTKLTAVGAAVCWF